MKSSKSIKFSTSYHDVFEYNVIERSSKKKTIVVKTKVEG